jgi:GT2 family glycosyltransferase
MSAPEVSVIIPTYNRAHLIARAVDCVLQQTYPHCHVIVVDDGSTDATPSVMAERYGNEPRVRYIRQPNAGVSAARNRALAEAKGDYIAYLDSDDLWRPWKLALQVACLERLRSDGVGILWTDKDIVDDAGALVRPRANRTAYGVYRLFPVDEMFKSSKPLAELAPGVGDPGDARVYWGDVYSYIAMGNLCAPSCVILTRERAEAVGKFDESMKSGEDHDYHLRACALGPAAFIDLATIDYRKGADDQLTAKSYELLIAQNALRTILAVLAKDSARIKLPPAVIRGKLASLHAWIGIKLIESKDNAGARSHFVSSLRQRPAQPRVWGLLAATTMPPRMTNALRSSLRAVKSVARRSRRP